MTTETTQPSIEKLTKAIAVAKAKFAKTLDPSRRAILDETIKTLEAALASAPAAVPEKPKKTRKLIIQAEAAPTDHPEAKPLTIDVTAEVSKVVPMAQSRKSFGSFKLPESFKAVLSAGPDGSFGQPGSGTARLCYRAAGRRLELACAGGFGDQLHAAWVLTDAIPSHDFDITVTRLALVKALSGRGEKLVRFIPKGSLSGDEGNAAWLTIIGTPDVRLMGLDEGMEPHGTEFGALAYSKARLTNLERALAFAADAASTDPTRDRLCTVSFALLDRDGARTLRVWGTDGHRQHWSDFVDVPAAVVPSWCKVGGGFFSRSRWFGGAVPEIAQALQLDEDQTISVTFDAKPRDPATRTEAMTRAIGGWTRKTASLAVVELPLGDGTAWVATMMESDDGDLTGRAAGLVAQRLATSERQAKLHVEAGPWATLLSTALTAAADGKRGNERSEALRRGLYFEAAVSSETVELTCKPNGATKAEDEKFTTWRCPATSPNVTEWTSLKASLQGQYLLDAVAAAQGSERVSLSFEGKTGPLLIQVGVGESLMGAGNLAHGALVMPVRADRTSGSEVHGPKAGKGKGKRGEIKGY